MIKHNLMKTKLAFLVIMFTTIMTFAQNGINYKAVIKDNLGNVVANDLIAIQFTILDGATNVYQETQTPTTDDNGIIIVNIGEGTPTFTPFSTVDWSSSNHFLNVQLNTGGGLVDMGTTAFKPVPYALMAKNIENPLWTKNGFNIGHAGGNVGIGTTSPSAPLEVYGTGPIIPRITSTNNTSGLALYRPGPTSVDWSLLNATNNELQLASSTDDLSSGIVRLRFKSNGDIIMAQNEGRVGIGTFTPVNPLSVVQASGTANTVRIETLDHPTGKDLLELIVPSGSTAGSQFIEMQNGFDIVAAINSDGSAKFKSVQFEDNTVQTTAAVGPIAYGFVQSNGNVSSGSGNFSATWNAVDNRYDITITGENYFWTLFTTNITSGSAAIDRIRVSSSNGKMIVFLYNDTGSLIQGNFQFVTYK